MRRPRNFDLTGSMKFAAESGHGDWRDETEAKAERSVFDGIESAQLSDAGLQDAAAIHERKKRAVTRFE